MQIQPHRPHIENIAWDVRRKQGVNVIGIDCENLL